MGKAFIWLLCGLLLALSACGKNRDKPPSNRPAYGGQDAGEVSEPDNSRAGQEKPFVDGRYFGTAYIVQVNVVNSRKEADRLAAALRAARISNEIERLEQGGFRVYVGKHLTKQRAESMLKKILEAGFGTARVVAVEPRHGGGGL